MSYNRVTRIGWSTLPIMYHERRQAVRLIWRVKPPEQERYRTTIEHEAMLYKNLATVSCYEQHIFQQPILWLLNPEEDPSQQSPQALASKMPQRHLLKGNRSLSDRISKVSVGILVH